MLLAGDIGGTKTDLAVFSGADGPRSPLRQAEFASREYASLRAIVQEFLRGGDEAITSACFAVAGPVIGARAKITNLPWAIDASELANASGIGHVLLVNDLVATALSIPLLGPADVMTLAMGTSDPRGPIAVIAPGTGLGEAFLTWEADTPRGHASEGGHSDFAPADELQAGLLAYMRERIGHVSVEHVCSGIGIPNIYAFLREAGETTESAEIAQQLKTVEDPTPIIVESGLHSPHDPLCRATVDMFIAILGAEAGNLALKVLSTGGVYLAGGIPKRVFDDRTGQQFLQAFRFKGRMSRLVEAMPVHVVLEQTALFGCASIGLDAEASG